MKKGLLLDRDGIVNREIGRHVYLEDDLHILPDIGDFLQKAMELGFTIVIVSNQSGIGKGLYDHDTVEHLHHRIREELQKKGVEIADFFYAPHHPNTGNSLIRKPEPLMIERALAKHGLDPSRSLFFGDKGSDKEAGERAGIRSILVESNSSLLPYIDELKRIH
ncbi:MAG: D-glycero-alpha-D-manno-heptose-1,7-bisphosphate 7-phosphatase [Flavobacteriales bacterium]